MNDQQYLQYCRDLMASFARDLSARVDSLPAEDPLKNLAGEFLELGKNGKDLYGDGPTLISRLFTGFPDFAPTFPRDLLWFFGGECLHFMPDEEIGTYQQLDQLRRDAGARGEILDMRSARANLLKLQ